MDNTVVLDFMSITRSDEHVLDIVYHRGEDHRKANGPDKYIMPDTYGNVDDIIDWNCLILKYHCHEGIKKAEK